MKRIHMHISVDDLAKAIRYYTALLGAQPSVEKKDYAKWMLDDPGLNLAVSLGCGKRGLSHLGVQVEDPRDLEGIRTRLAQTAVGFEEESDAHCCYARSDKVWSRDPDGVVWESFLTHGSERERDGDAGAITKDVPVGSCCA